MRGETSKLEWGGGRNKQIMRRMRGETSKLGWAWEWEWEEKQVN